MLGGGLGHLRLGQCKDMGTVSSSFLVGVLANFPFVTLSGVSPMRQIVRTISWFHGCLVFAGNY